MEQEKRVGITTERPWGKFTSISEGEFYQIKEIEVKPYSKLSLQAHNFRSEHWVVVEGEGIVTLGIFPEKFKKTPLEQLKLDELKEDFIILSNEKIKLEKNRLEAGKSVCIPQKAIHSMENISDKWCKFVETQYSETGNTNENDIVRYQDDYGRVK